MATNSWLCLGVLLIVGVASLASGAAVMSVDLGSEWMKVSATQFNR